MVFCFLIKYFFPALLYFINTLIQPLKCSLKYNFCEFSHLVCYLVTLNLYSKAFLLALLFSSTSWFLFSFFWSLPNQFIFLTTLISLLFTAFLHKKENLVYAALLYSLLPKGTHSYNLAPVELQTTALSVSTVATVFLKSFNLRQYLGLLFFFSLPSSFGALRFLGLFLYNFSLSFLNSPRSFFFNFLEKWVFTTNHKRVGINYMWYVVIAGVVTTVFATAIKLELGEPGSLYCGGNMRLYLSLVTGHAVIMVFLAYVPVYYGVFTNYLIPIQLGARDFAYPRLNNFSFWVFPPSLFFFSNSLLKYQGLVTGWTFYPPLSSKKYSSSFNMDITILSVLSIATASLISTTNLISTYRYMRGASMKADYRFIPLSVYGTLFGALLFTFAAPVLGIAMFMLYFDRHGITNFFNVAKGGDVVLYQHLFWFFGHPEVYVLILPTFGYVSNIIVFATRHNLLAYDHMVISMGAICLLGSIVWGHHMYIGGLNRGLKNLFSATSLFVSIPSTLKIHSWIATLQSGNLHFSVQLIWIFIFLTGILIGGITGMVLGMAGFDVLYHDTYYVVGHFHLVLSMGGFAVIFAVFFHYWFYFFRVGYNKFLAVLQAVLFFVGELVTFVPALFLGMSGMPRRINDYPVYFSGWHSMSSLGHGLVVLSLFVFLALVLESKYSSRKFLYANKYSKGVPYFANRHSAYLMLITQLRTKLKVKRSCGNPTLTSF